MASKFFRKDLKSLNPYIVDGSNYKVRLDANESFINIHPYLLEEFKEKLNSAFFNRYPDADCEIICSLYGEYTGISKEHIMAGNGSDELVQIIMNTFVEKDEKVVMLYPDFSMYSFYTLVAGGVPVKISLDDDFGLDIDEFINEVNRIKPKLIILSNPNSPTGGIIEEKDLIKIIENCPCLVVIDEAYYEFYKQSIINRIDMYDNLIVLRTCSKAAGMAAIRLGFLITNVERINELKSVKPPFNVNSITQSFGEVLLQHKEIIINNSDRIIEERENLFHKLSEFQQLTVFASKANFILIKVDSAEKFNQMLLKVGIKVRDFGDDALKNYFRVTVGSREENEILLESINKYFIGGGE